MIRQQVSAYVNMAGQVCFAIVHVQMVYGANIVTKCVPVVMEDLATCILADATVNLVG